MAAFNLAPKMAAKLSFQVFLEFTGTDARKNEIYLFSNIHNNIQKCQAATDKTPKKIAHTPTNVKLTFLVAS